MLNAGHPAGLDTERPLHTNHRRGDTRARIRNDGRWTDGMHQSSHDTWAPEKRAWWRRYRAQIRVRLAADPDGENVPTIHRWFRYDLW